jgi:hypothetical protein
LNSGVYGSSSNLHVDVATVSQKGCHRKLPHTTLRDKARQHALNPDSAVAIDRKREAQSCRSDVDGVSASEQTSFSGAWRDMF